jgi:hypothetical protein
VRRIRTENDNRERSTGERCSATLSKLVLPRTELRYLMTNSRQLLRFMACTSRAAASLASGPSAVLLASQAITSAKASCAVDDSSARPGSRRAQAMCLDPSSGSRPPCVFQRVAPDEASNADKADRQLCICGTLIERFSEDVDAPSSAVRPPRRASLGRPARSRRYIVGVPSGVAVGLSGIRRRHRDAFEPTAIVPDRVSNRSCGLRCRARFPRHQSSGFSIP